MKPHLTLNYIAVAAFVRKSDTGLVECCLNCIYGNVQKKIYIFYTLKQSVMKSQADQNKQAPQPPGREGDKQRDRGQGGGQPKPGNDQDYETPDIPKEIPKREIERKPSDPQSEPEKDPDTAPKQDIPDPGGSEENNDVQEKSPDLMVEDDRDMESLVDKRDRFPFPNK